MFTGKDILNLDSKGRLAIPAKHRDVLSATCAGRMKLTVDQMGCLLLYPLPAWEPVAEKLLTLSQFNPKARAVQQLILGHAEDVELDSAGRILIPVGLRGFAGLDKAIAFVGMGNKFELWDEGRWNAKMADALAMSPEDIAAQLDGFVL